VVYSVISTKLTKTSSYKHVIVINSCNVMYTSEKAQGHTIRGIHRRENDTDCITATSGGKRLKFSIM